MSYVRYDFQFTTGVAATIRPIHKHGRKTVSYREYDTIFAGRISTIVYISIFPAFDDGVINIRTSFVNMEKFKVKFV